MKKSIWLLAALSLLTVSCMVKEPEQDGMLTDAPKIFATAVSAGPSTRVAVTESDGTSRSVVWEKGDALSVFYRSSFNLKYVLEGEGGEPSGIFAYASGHGTALQFPDVYSVYPYDNAIEFDGQVASLTFPGKQTYTEGSFDPKANLMAGVARPGENMEFKNVGGYLVLELWGEDVTVSKVVVKGNAGEALAGPASVWIYQNSAPEIEIAAETAETSVTLTCATPVTVGTSEDDATAFWFVVPPTWFGEGLTVTVYGPDGGMFTRSATNSFEIVRSQVYRLSTEVELEYLNGYEYVEMAPGFKVATKNVGAENPEDYGDTFAWGEVDPRDMNDIPSDYSQWLGYKWLDDSYYMSRYTMGHYEYSDQLNREWIVGDKLTRLAPEDDAATANWGGGWCMLTAEQVEWLFDNCDWNEVTHVDAKGREIWGYEVVSNHPDCEGNTFFIPFGGHWTASLYQYSYSNYDYWDDYGNYPVDYFGALLMWGGVYSRYNTFAVRPVYGTVPFESMDLSEETLDLIAGMQERLYLSFEPGYASERYSWSSSDESVVTVDGTGRVTAVSAGQADIIVTGENGMTVSCAVSVTPAVVVYGKQWTFTDDDGVQRILDLKYTSWYQTIYGWIDEDGRPVYEGVYATFYQTGSPYPHIYQDSYGDIIYDVCDFSLVNPTENSAQIRTSINGYDQIFEATVLDPPVTFINILPVFVINGVTYPMWTSSGYDIDCYGDFRSVNMGGSSSATLPIHTVIGSDGKMSYGAAEDFEGLDLTGKIAVVSRGGNISFYIKADNAAAAGASAIMIVNNEPGHIGLDMSNMTSHIPYFLVPQDSYDALMTATELLFEEAGTSGAYD